MLDTNLKSKINKYKLIPININIYKYNFTSKIRIFPGDLTGSPDDFFLGNYLNLRENL